VGDVWAGWVGCTSTDLLWNVGDMGSIVWRGNESVRGISGRGQDIGIVQSCIQD
jgi:hypothetical protein